MTLPDFDIATDYMSLIDQEDKAKEKGEEFPYLRGLKKLAYGHRQGLKSVRSRIVKVPSVGVGGLTGKDEKPDCIAAVTITYEFNDGSVFEGSADASYKAHKAPYNLHLVALAESKAEARAIRRAFNISAVAKEEMGTVQNFEEEEKEEALKMEGPITDVQLQGIKRLAKRKQLRQSELLEKIGRSEAGDISKLTYADGLKALKYVNKHKAKPATAEVEEAEVEEVEV
jgi:hypothetical protein